MKQLFSKLSLTLIVILITASNIFAAGAAKDSALSPRVTVKDVTKYSKEFLDGLVNSGMSNKFMLIDNLLIVDNKDTSRLPSFVEAGKPRTLTGCNGKDCYTLTLEKVNFSTLKYKCDINKGGKTMTISGEADMSPLFFLGSEVLTDEVKETDYAAFDYSEQNKDCFFSFRIGNNKGVLGCKIIMTCKDETKNVTLNDSPLLKVK